MGAEAQGDSCRRDPGANVCALFVVNADDTGLDEVLSSAAFSGLSLNPSPDGHSLLYVRWAEGEPGGIHIVDIETATDHRVQLDGFPETVNVYQAQFSPDGTHILFDWLGVTDNYWGVVPVTGGAPVKLGPAWPQGPDGHGPEAYYSPDGKSIVAFYPHIDGTTEVWLLDPTGGQAGGDRKLSLSSPHSPVWQRVAR